MLNTMDHFMNSKLMKYGLGISVIAVGGSIWMEKLMQKKFRQEDYFQNAIVMLQKYEPGAQILGRPIYSKKLNLASAEEVLVTPLSAKVSIHLKGSNQEGILHVLASRYAADEKHKWNIDQLDLELKASKQRWKFYDRYLQEEGSTVTDPQKGDDPVEDSD